MASTQSTRVLRVDGKLINVVHKRGHLMICATGCCCGHTERRFAAVPTELYHNEWERRKLRNMVHLTQSGCLGPCSLANVVLLMFDGYATWFQSINSEAQIIALYDYIERMLKADKYLAPPPELSDYVFDYYTWSRQTASPVLPESVQNTITSMPSDGILLLTHADTDLLALSGALADLPAGFPPVAAVNLLAIKNDSHMMDMLAEQGTAAKIIIMRILGRPGSIPGFSYLLDRVREYDQALVIVSGTGSLEPELSAISTVPPAIAHDVMAYFEAGGRTNIAQMLRFLSDHLLMYGFGYEPPVQQPAHGLYHPDLPSNTTIEAWSARCDPARPTVGILFYRSHWMSGNLAFVDALIREVEAQGANTLAVFTASLRLHETRIKINEKQVDRWPLAFNFLVNQAGQSRVDTLINTTSFAMGDINPDGATLSNWSTEALTLLDVPLLQAITGSTTRQQWEVSTRGLNPLDTAMNVALPEFDGHIITVPISFKERQSQLCEGDCVTCSAPYSLSPVEAMYYAPMADRVEHVVRLALRLAALKRKANPQKRVAFIFTNAAGKASRVGNAVGLDAPASLMVILQAMRDAGYRLDHVPPSGDVLIQTLLDRCSYDEIYLTPDQLSHAAGQVSTDQYRVWFESLPGVQRQEMAEQWGAPPGTAYVEEGQIALAGLNLGNVFVALQPPRGYGMDPNAIYHRPDLPPPHHYYALYRWLRDEWRADAIVHVGKHGTLEWLPGKSVGLSGNCYPDTFLADLPLIYPFILNDPGEGAQAKRRSHAVVIDHLTPPMTTADSYEELAQLMQLVDEYYQMEMLDPSKLPLLQQQIWNLIKQAKLDQDLKGLLRRDHGDHRHEWDDELTTDGTPVSLVEMGGRDVAHLIESIDGYLCELAGAQIRDGLHILGQVPQGEQMIGLLFALTRLPNLEIPSLRGSVASGFGLDLDALLAEPSSRLDSVPSGLTQVADRPLVSNADALETVDELCHHLLALLGRANFQADAIDQVLAETFGSTALASAAHESLQRVLRFVAERIVPSLNQTTAEIDNLLHALDGGYIPAGPSGAPTRGMAHVLPTGRNFYAVDPRTLPSMAAWEVGQALAREVLARHLHETGAYPDSVGISVWGTSAMRTHGDDVAEILSLLGVRPVWQAENHRLTGVALIPLHELGRPRIDVTIRISGFFRDAFPHLIAMLDEAVRIAIEADEPAHQNYIRKHYLQEMASSLVEGLPQDEAQRQARYRIFGSKPGMYGAGILPLIDERNWQDDSDLAETYVNWGGYAYTTQEQGVDARRIFCQRLAGVQIALHNQDNREHDIFDSDDYLQFHGGMIATIRALTGRQPHHYFGDTQNPNRPVVRDLKEEVLRVFRTRVVNPKWIESITKHGYKGGLELAATVDYLFGYDATANVLEDWMYEQTAGKYALDPAMQEFFNQSNPWALHAITERLLEAAQRKLWAEPSPETLAALQKAYLSAEMLLEGRTEKGLA